MGNRSYIVQEQIDLLRLNNNIVDVRILVQKNDRGDWETTGMACRQGKRGSITSNISSGGSGRKLDMVLNQNFDDETSGKNNRRYYFLAMNQQKPGKTIARLGMGVELA